MKCVVTCRWRHLLFNAVAQLVVGIPLELMHGAARTAVIYVAGVLAGMSVFLANNTIWPTYMGITQKYIVVNGWAVLLVQAYRVFYRLLQKIIAIVCQLSSAVTVANDARLNPKHEKRQQNAQSRSHIQVIYTVWVKKKSPLGDLTFFHFFLKRLRICYRFFTHLLNVPIFARLQVFIQLLPILTKLCHIKRDYPVHIICTKCPKRAKTRAFRRLRKSLIALLIVVCGKSL